MRYDAAIIGAGADGLAAAATLAKSGLKTIVLERSEHPGGRCTTREIHPGFRAAPFCDELAPIPPTIFWALDLARRGVVFMPSPLSTALWPDRSGVLWRDDSFLAQSAARTAAAIRRIQFGVPPKRRRLFIGTPTEGEPWPGGDWATASLDDVMAANTVEADRASHLLARALTGRAAHPSLAGSALHLLAPGIGGGGPVAVGLDRLADALTAAAQEVGAEISCGLEVTDVSRKSGKVSGVRLADGTEIAARTVLSTLDLKRTFLSLFAWSDLPKQVSQRVASFRMAGSTARLLFALDGLPDAPAFATRHMFRGPIHLAPEPDNFAAAYAAWRAGTSAERLPVTLRFPSVTDPGLCPPGAAVMTATVGCVPACLFDGPWTREKRNGLRDRVMAAAEEMFPGVWARVQAVDIIVPPDMEDAIGATDGDLWGGEIAPDQMLAFRPWLDHVGSRTPIEGVYLAGPSSAAGTLGTCAAGVIAANAMIADLKRGRFK